MGSGISKLNYHIYIPEDFKDDQILLPLINKIFNKRIDRNAILILIRNHQFSMYTKIRIILVRYLTLHTSIHPPFFFRIASILDYVNNLIYTEQVASERHHYPIENTEHPPPIYTEG